MSGRAKRVLFYTVALLAAPLVAIPWEKGTPEFALSLATSGLFIAVASIYVLWGELRPKTRGLLGFKLIATTLITLVFGVGLVVGSVVYLLRGR
ncbi:MAG TPA: hypothetical protein VF588_16450 [Pyrinomonadaceae bacterium]|jgi:hypothetical protein